MQKTKYFFSIIHFVALAVALLLSLALLIAPSMQTKHISVALADRLVQQCPMPGKGLSFMW